jgi:nucleotide-binding universal stress UspA family protein
VGPIVVGVDGSDESKAALSWAAEEARVRGAKLRVVHAWSIPPMAMPSMSLEPAAFPSTDDIDAFKESAQRSLDEQTAAVVGDDSKLEVEKVLVQEFPAQALVQESESADLLVVGSRGHGGFTGVLLGSVSQHCAHHARCPVVIVRGRTS